jgi:4-hydroxysphinganine ceramide fatty acyl 2-hydroxylase
MQYVTKGRVFYQAHFMLHGIHHAFPMDKGRLMLPPVLGYFYFAVLFKYPFEMIVPADLLPAWLIGFYIGYLMYDLTHYFIHHSNPPDGSYFKMMKMYHLQHHYKKGEQGFGISNKIWDRIFDTEIKSKEKEG